MNTFKAVATIPLHRQIAEHLAGRIISAELPDRSRLPSTVELAKIYDVTPVTIHKSLQSLVKRQLVERRPRQGTYVRSRERTNVVALVFGKNPFRDQSRLYSHLVDSFQREIWKRDMNLKIYFDFENGRRTMFDLVQDLRSREVKALVVSARGPRLVDFMGNHNSTPWIEAFHMDHYSTIRNGVEYLVGRGYRRVAVISMFPEKLLYPSYDEQFRDEVRGMEDAARAGGAAAEIFRWGQTEKDGYDKGRAWLLEHRERFDAILVGHDVLCQGLLMALLELGIRVPGDMGLLAHVNRGCDFASPVRLSRLEMDPARMASGCLDTLSFALAEGITGKVTQASIEATVVPGHSCGE